MKKYKKYLSILPCVIVSYCSPEQSSNTKVVKEKGLYNEIIANGFFLKAWPFMNALIGSRTMINKTRVFITDQS